MAPASPAPRPMMVRPNPCRTTSLRMSLSFAPSDAYAEFTGSQTAGVRDYAVNPDHGKQERESRKKPQQQRPEAPRSHGIREDFIHGHDLGHGLIIIYACDGTSHGARERSRVGIGPQYERHRESRLLRVRNEKLRGGLPFERILPHVRDGAHDFAPRGRRRPEGNVLAERVSAAEYQFRETLVEDRNMLAYRIGFVEGAPVQEANPHHMEVLRADGSNRNRLAPAKVFRTLHVHNPRGVERRT